jgi:hypothetical protein
MFPPYSFTLDSTTMASTHLFDNVDIYTSYSSLFNPNLSSLNDIYTINTSSSTASTYDNTVDVKSLINNISHQLQAQIAAQIQANMQMNPSLFSPGIIAMNPNGVAGGAGTGGAGGAGGVGNGIVQDHIDGVSNVFAPNIVINPVVPQAAFESLALKQ